MVLNMFPEKQQENILRILRRNGLLDTRHSQGLYSIVLSFKNSKNTKHARLHRMITSKGKINELCLVCHFFSHLLTLTVASFSPLPLSRLTE